MYTHGGDCYRGQITYDFSANINPLGMPGTVKNAAYEGVLLSGRYPDISNKALITAFAKRFGIGCTEEEAGAHLVFGNGAGELIYLIARAIGGKGIAYGPTFTLYEEAMLAAGGTFSYVDLSSEDGFAPTEDLVGRMGEDTSVCFLCHPNNPTGQPVPETLMKKLIDRAYETKTYLVVDESFLPFAEDAVSLLSDTEGLHPYMIVLHSLTKIYAMPGLRLGYAWFSEGALAEHVRLLTQPWNVSIPAQTAGVAAFNDRSFTEKTRDYIRAQKAYLLSELSGCFEKLCPGAANYMMFLSRPDLGSRLLDEDILIRDLSDLHGLAEGWFRIAIRSESENRVLIRAIKKILGEE